MPMVKRHKRRFAGLKQYELTTTRTEYNGMPFPVFAKNKKAALAFVKKRLRKGEKIISLVRSY